MIDNNALLAAMNRIAETKGPFDLFALFLREDAPDRWDLVVSAPWIEEGRLVSFAELVQLLAQHLGEEQMQELSRVVSIERDNPGLDAILRAVAVEPSITEIRDSVFFGLRIRHAFIFQAKRSRPRAPHAA
jgi:hypothetical protein